MKKIFFLLSCLLLPLGLLAQHTLQGTITEEVSGNPLPGATVVLENTSRATTTNLEGHFELADLEEGTYTLRVSFVGYETYTRRLRLDSNMNLPIQLAEGTTYLADEVIVSATRATEKTPTTYSEVEREAIEKQNFGQDIPYLLNFTPSIVTTSDAGAGVGYTGLRIRGSDATRINVTVNGIPLNDAESHGVFWVNMPDFASSVESMQIQRGVGTSTNGAAAFGATVNIQTSTLNQAPYAETENSYGSFNTWRHTARVGTGLINDHFTFDARLSKISSDGYIDRSFSDLKSFYLSGGYYTENTLIKANIFSGKEHTYQAWYGTPEELLETDRTYNHYTYENETDNYQQDHYQLIAAHDLNPALTLNGALHYTRGRGYYEQFREDDPFTAYPSFGIDSLVTENRVTADDGSIVTMRDTIFTTDLIRQRWLDNHFYGATWSADYQPGNRLQFVLGGGWNRYLGDHFGEVIWSQFAGNSRIRDRYYDNTAKKEDLNIYLKTFYQLTASLNLFVDVQGRFIDYSFEGIDNDLRPIEGAHNFNFFNPKAGATYVFDPQNRLYASFAKGSREPVRNDFIDAPQGRLPEAEILRNLEVGYERKGRRFQATANYYLMDYKNQLVLTGELNDVGSPIRTNVDRSYRTGVELQLAYHPHDWINLSANATFSRNKISRFTEAIPLYNENWVLEEVQYNEHPETDIAYSPSVIAGGIFSLSPFPWMEASLLSKYVGKQYLDNTQSESRRLDPYFTNDLRINTHFSPLFLKELTIGLLVNNLFNVAYESNGYTYGYGYAGDVAYYNYYYPQAGRNFLVNVGVAF